MKFFIVFACALAAISAGQIVAPQIWGAQHLPVIGPNGVPVDTAEVQHARAAHLVHKIDAHARNGDLAIAHAPVIAHASPIVSSSIVAQQVAPVVSAYSNSVIGAPIVAQQVSPVVSGWSGSIVAARGPAAWPTTAVLPTSVNGVPLETPEVAAARVNHVAAHNEALVRTVHARNENLAIAAPIVANAAPWLAQAAPVVASTYAQAAPVIASSPWLAQSPLVASTYAHGSPVVASGLW